MTRYAKVAETLDEDYHLRQGPFENTTLPEQWLVDECGRSKDRPVLLTHWAMLDYNRDARRLAENVRDMWENDQWLFSPYEVAVRGEEDIVDVFKRIPTRYANRDAHAWYQNLMLLRSEYSGSWRGLLNDCQHHAPTVLDRVRDDGFHVLGGKKVGPFWLKILHQHYRSLYGINELDIPVDTHIRRLTRDLVGIDINDDGIRTMWRRFCKRTDADMANVDTALWLIGNRWDEWGEDYWEDVKDVR